MKKKHMIRLGNIRTAQQVALPRPQALPEDGSWNLTLVNTTTRHKVTADVMQAVPGALTVNLQLVLPSLDDGEWTYTLERGDVVVSAGLAIVGDEPYDEETVQYRQYVKTIQYNE